MENEGAILYGWIIASVDLIWIDYYKWALLAGIISLQLCAVGLKMFCAFSLD